MSVPSNMRSIRCLKSGNLLCGCCLDPVLTSKSVGNYVHHDLQPYFVSKSSENGWLVGVVAGLRGVLSGIQVDPKVLNLLLQHATRMNTHSFVYRHFFASTTGAYRAPVP